MSIFVQRSLTMPGAQQLIPQRLHRRIGSAVVTSETALRHSVVWACLRLRADLISTMPVDVYRRVGSQQVSVPTPRMLRKPSGERVDITEWLYSTQVDLDQYGNTLRPHHRTRRRRPAGTHRPVPRGRRHREGPKGGKLTSTGSAARPSRPDIWHEKQHTRAGLHVGLSPIASAAYSIGMYLSAQQFALDWFANGTIPSGHLKNTAKTLNKDEAGHRQGSVQGHGRQRRRLRHRQRLGLRDDRRQGQRGAVPRDDEGDTPGHLPVLQRAG
jgi:phage portal protein BeeE